MAHPHYYRVRAAVLEWELTQTRLGQQLAKARAVFKEELRACELDPEREYVLDPKARDITPAKANADAAPEAPAAAEGESV